MPMVDPIHMVDPFHIVNPIHMVDPFHIVNPIHMVDPIPMVELILCGPKQVSPLWDFAKTTFCDLVSIWNDKTYFLEWNYFAITYKYPLTKK